MSVTQFNPAPKRPLPTSTSMPSQPAAAAAINQQPLSEACTARKYSVVPVSHCSLHSCTSSELSSADETTLTSYSTSVSTDTLYWDNHPHQSTQHPSLKKQHKPPSVMRIQRPVGPVVQYEQIPPPAGCPPYKPKSWDNLTTKAFGGYGFGYGYSDVVSHQQAARNKAAQKVNKRLIK